MRLLSSLFLSRIPQRFSHKLLQQYFEIFQHKQYKRCNEDIGNFVSFLNQLIESNFSNYLKNRPAYSNFNYMKKR